MLRSTGSFTSMSTKRTTRTILSGRGSVSETELASLLSKASHQATMAARSILVAGGTRETALSTAQATAQAVLCPKLSEVPKGTPSLGKRRAKRHAEVIGSMVLMSLVNPHAPPVEATARRAVTPSTLGFSTLDLRGSGRSISTTSVKQEIPNELPKRNSSSHLKGNSRSTKSGGGSGGSARDRSTNQAAEHTSSSRGFFRKKHQSRKQQQQQQQRYQSNSYPDTIETDPKVADFIGGCAVDGETVSSSNSQHRSYFTYDDSEDVATTNFDEFLEEIEDHVAESTSSKGFIKRTVDPLLTTITNAFICGPSSIDQNTLQSETRDETNNVEDLAMKCLAPLPEKSRRYSKRDGQSLSTYDSEQLIRELNVSSSSTSSEPSHRLPPRRKKTPAPPKKPATETMEAVVLRAFSTSPEKPPKTATSRQQSNYRSRRGMDRSFQSSDDIFSGIMSDASGDGEYTPRGVEDASDLSSPNTMTRANRFAFLRSRRPKNAKESE